MNVQEVLTEFESYAVKEVVTNVKALLASGKASWMFDSEYDHIVYLVAKNGKTLAVLWFKDGKISDSEFRDDLGG